jgi:hypothetical protein
VFVDEPACGRTVQLERGRCEVVRHRVHGGREAQVAAGRGEHRVDGLAGGQSFADKVFHAPQALDVACRVTAMAAGSGEGGTEAVPGLPHPERGDADARLE